MVSSAWPYSDQTRATDPRGQAGQSAWPVHWCRWVGNLIKCGDAMSCWKNIMTLVTRCTFSIKSAIYLSGCVDNLQQTLYLNRWSNQQIPSQTTPNIHWESIFEGVFSGPMRITDRLQVGISCINSILIEFCSITEEYVVKNPMMYKHQLAKLNMKFVVIRLESTHMLQMIRIQTIMYGSPYPWCKFTKLIRYLSNVGHLATLY